MSAPLRGTVGFHAAYSAHTSSFKFRVWRIVCKSSVTTAKISLRRQPFDLSSHPLHRSGLKEGLSVNFVRSIFLAVTLVVSSGSVATAQDFDKGYAAYQAGDYATALAEWRPLAEQGDALAQFVLGVMYNDGEGVPQDNAEAVKWYRLAAEQGNDSGQLNLGLMYNNGWGIPQDHALAVRWYRSAANQGNANAQYMLGFMIRSGIGSLQDFAEVFKWYRLAAEQGYANAQSGLGFMYEHGEFVPQDNIRAHMWLNIAGANGAALGSKFRSEIGEEMTAADISLAQAMARECMSSGYSDCGW
jgi:hypothetical protein